VDGTTNDFIRLRVEDSDGDVAFETPGHGDPGALNGLATTTLIPAGRLVPGETYEARLVFERIVLIDETTAAEGRVIYFARTDFNINTVPGRPGGLPHRTRPQVRTGNLWIPGSRILATNSNSRQK
jgi:hypothetical protein